MPRKRNEDAVFAWSLIEKKREEKSLGELKRVLRTA